MCIEWKKISEELPPLGKDLLVYAGNCENYPHFAQDRLNYGAHERRTNPALIYWESFDFDEITHWAELPTAPESV